jgi:hypothetical protein
VEETVVIGGFPLMAALARSLAVSSGSDLDETALVHSNQICLHNNMSAGMTTCALAICSSDRSTVGSFAKALSRSPHLCLFRH